MASCGIVRDEVIVLDREKDADHLMRLRCGEALVEDKQETMAFVTGKLKLAVSTIAAICRDRWALLRQPGRPPVELDEAQLSFGWQG